MARPPTQELTPRELEVMQVYWKFGELTATDARAKLANTGIDRAYVTVANLVRILVNKEYLLAMNDERPFRYQPVRSFDDVSGTFVGDVLKRVFGGSREKMEKMLVKLMDGRKKLSAKEREFLEQILQEDKK